MEALFIGLASIGLAALGVIWASAVPAVVAAASVATGLTLAICIACGLAVSRGPLRRAHGRSGRQLHGAGGLLFGAAGPGPLGDGRA